MMNGYGWGGWMGGMGWMWLWWLLVLAGVIALVVWIARTFAQAPPPGGFPTGRADPAEEILRQRYARGEISREEFEQRMDDLRRSGHLSSGGPA